MAAGSDVTHSTTEGFGRLSANSLNTFVSKTYCLENGLKATIRAISTNWPHTLESPAFR
jgi:hypothetical protein